MNTSHDDIIKAYLSHNPAVTFGYNRGLSVCQRCGMTIVDSQGHYIHHKLYGSVTLCKGCFSTLRLKRSNLSKGAKMTAAINTSDHIVESLLDLTYIDSDQTITLPVTRIEYDNRELRITTKDGNQCIELPMLKTFELRQTTIKPIKQKCRCGHGE